ncbi:MAG: response regulator [Planctomycetes bacterium]|nr:response regulator [Planctomycetota bacterium]
MPLSQPNPKNANRHRKSVVADLEQQIRTPMNTIIGLSSAEVAKGSDEQQSEAFQKINAAANSLMGILDELLSISKVDDGHLRINQEIFDVESVIADACDVDAEAFIAKKAELIVNIDPRISTKLLGDGTQVWQALRRLLDYAAANLGGGEAYLTVTRKSQTPEDESLKFIVYSTVAEERQEAVSQECGLAPGPDGQVELGPDIAAITQLVENNHGEIIFEETAPGEILCIFVLPFARVAASIPTIGISFADKFRNLRGKQALLVSACQPLRENLATVLQTVNMTSVTAASCAEAVSSLENAVSQRRLPDVVVLDLQLPDLDPKLIADFFKRAGLPPAPCLAFAHPATFERYEEGLKASGLTLADVGVSDCLEKPALPQTTFSQVSCFLRKTVSIGKEPFIVNLPEATTVSTPQLSLGAFSENKIDWQSVARFLHGFNQQDALQRLGNNYDLYGKMLSDFYRNLEKEIGEWNAPRATFDPEALRVSAHNLKSMAGYVGADRLRDVAMRTEAVCKEGAAPEKFAATLRELMGACKLTLHILQTAHQNSLSEPDNTAALRKLLSAAEFCECDLAKLYCRELRSGLKTWPENVIAAIRQDVNEFKFSEVAQMLRDRGVNDGAVLPHSDLPVILVIDDSPEAIGILYSLFADECRFCATTSGPLALEWLAKFHADLILLDVVMPQMNGIKVYKKIRECPHAQSTPIIFISGVSENDVEREVLNLGAADYILKPYNVATVQAKVHNQLALKKKHDQLVNTLREQRAALTQTQEAVIHGMAHLAEYRENFTGQHLKRIKEYTAILANKLHDLHPEMLSLLDVHYMVALAPVHDIGKVGIRDNILKKMGPLTNEEYEEMKRHTIYGADVIERTREDLGINNFVMDMARQIVTNHHERYDGSGYPYGLKGAEIPLAARIVALADVYDALTSERPYKPAISHARTAEIITKGDSRTRPEHFDPLILQAFMEAQDEFSRVSGH